jgi:hypothetical protein
LIDVDKLSPPYPKVDEEGIRTGCRCINLRMRGIILYAYLESECQVDKLSTCGVDFFFILSTEIWSCGKIVHHICGLLCAYPPMDGKGGKVIHRPCG